MEEKSKKSRIILSLIIAIIMALIFVLGFFTGKLTQDKTTRDLNKVLSLIEDHGIFITKTEDGKELSGSDLIKAIVDKVLSEDDYAEYYTKEEYDKIKSNSNGSYIGLGVSILNDSNTVYSVVGNSPAERSGLRGGDVLIAGKTAQSEFTAFSQNNDAINYITENISTENVEFTFKVLRNETELQYVVKPASYSASYIKYFDSEKSLTINSDKSDREVEYVESEVGGFNADTALIRFSSFQGDAYGQLEYALNLMNQRGRTKLILDLRSNGGGRMDVLSQISSLLINNGGASNFPIVISRGKDGDSTFYSKANKYASFLQKTVVLCDSNTASASECLIGAMLYYGASERDANFSMENVVISKNQKGEARTFGKGIMQTTYDLLGGSALKLTTALIYQPDGETSIHNKGIVQENPLNQVEDAFALSRALEIMNG